MRVLVFLAVSSKPQLKDISIPEQERLAEAWCAQYGHTIVEKLVVPGHSRSKNVVSLLREYRAKGIDAYEKLESHCQRQDFDVLWVFDHSRLARSMSLYAWAVEITIEAGAKIYFFQGGEIEGGDDMDMKIALGGISATAGVKRLVRMRSAAFSEMASQGKPIGPKAPFGYRIVKTEKGKLEKLAIDTSKDRFLRDLAEILLTGVSYNRIPKEMSDRGHLKPNGKRYDTTFFHRLFFSPLTWGHSARFWVMHPQRYTSFWFCDPTEPLPDGIEVYYGTHEPLYKGELATRLIAELRRRSAIGLDLKWRHPNVRAYSGIFVCNVCGHTLIYNISRGKNVYLQCNPARDVNRVPHTVNIRIDRLDEAVQRFLVALKELRGDRDVEHLFGGEDSYDERALIQREIDALERQVQGMLERLKNPDFSAVSYLVDQQIVTAGRQITVLKQRLSDLNTDYPAQEIETRRQALIQLRAMTWEEMTEMEKNQFLSALLGKHRLRYRAGDIELVRR